MVAIMNLPRHEKWVFGLIFNFESGVGAALKAIQQDIEAIAAMQLRGH